MTGLLPKAFLLVTWLAALAALVLMTSSFSGASARFGGIADDQEQTVRFTGAVEIVAIHVVPGQEVAAGELLLEARDPALESELKIVLEKTQALRFRNREVRATMEAEIVQLRADLEAALAEIDAETRLVRSRHEATQALLRSGAMAGAASATDDALASLDTRRNAMRRAVQSRIDDLIARLGSNERPIDAEIAELERQRDEIERQRSQLHRYALFPGKVGSILFRSGETAPPYQPLLTIHSVSPAFVKGYIHEDVLNTVQLHQVVWVRSTNTVRASVWHEGVVGSLGSRIVEFPARLKVNPISSAWGREVVIHLRDGHDLLLGERVDVHLDAPAPLMTRLKAYLWNKTADTPALSRGALDSSGFNPADPPAVRADRAG